jgi:hypothetical protein
LGKKENEINACNAFIKRLYEIRGIEYKIDSSPDDEKDSNDPDVDFILKDINGRHSNIAVEHTIVEAHNNQMLYVNQLNDIEKEIKHICQGKLPTSYYFALTLPPPLIIGMCRKNKEQFVKEISNWIPDAAKPLTTNQWSSCLYNGHKVSLWCVGSCLELNGTVGMISVRPEEAEKESENRFRRAIEEKLPKLMKYKDSGYSTALLLEDVSFSHANPKADWKDLIPNQYHSEFLSKIDYVVIFVSNQKKMIVGSVWKEESQLYAEIPENRRFSCCR